MKFALVLGFNVAMLACGIAGLVYALEWASNIFLFACWFMATLTILVFMVPEARAEAANVDFAMPPWVYVVFDIAIAVLIVATGHFALGALYSLSAIMGNEMVRMSKQPA